MNTKEKIIRAGLKVFNQKGYDKTTTRSIAKEAGVNEVTLFRLFGTKENILKEVIRKNTPLSIPLHPPASEEGGDLRGDLIRLALGFYHGLAKNRRAVLMSLCAAEKYPVIRKIVASGPAEQVTALSRHFLRLKEKGLIRDIDSELTARQFTEMLFGLCMSSGLGRARDGEVETIIGHFIDVFIDGVRR